MCLDLSAINQLFFAQVCEGPWLSSRAAKEIWQAKAFDDPRYEGFF
jgi:hypothetical protein